MTDKNQQADSAEPKQELEAAPRPTGRAPYSPPTVTLFGTVAELTLGTQGAVNDLGTTRAV